MNNTYNHRYYSITGSFFPRWSMKTYRRSPPQCLGCMYHRSQQHAHSIQSYVSNSMSSKVPLCLPISQQLDGLRGAAQHGRREARLPDPGLECRIYILTFQRLAYSFIQSDSQVRLNNQSSWRDYISMGVSKKKQLGRVTTEVSANRKCEQLCTLETRALKVAQTVEEMFSGRKAS